MKHSTGIKIANTVIILSIFALIISCSKDIDNYYITIKNDYFESLYDVTLGNTKFDTLKVKETSSVIIVEKGIYNFSTETASDLRIKSVVNINGNNRDIDLLINENGILIKE